MFTFLFVPPLTVMIHTKEVTEASQAEQQRDQRSCVLSARWRPWFCRPTPRRRTF
jgi:hypothetical protein